MNAPDRLVLLCSFQFHPISPFSFFRRKFLRLIRAVYNIAERVFAGLDAGAVKTDVFFRLTLSPKVHLIRSRHFES